jgi:hypothetical protein
MFVGGEQRPPVGAFLVWDTIMRLRPRVGRQPLQRIRNERSMNSEGKSIPTVSITANSSSPLLSQPSYHSCLNVCSSREAPPGVAAMVAELRVAPLSGTVP